MKSFNNTKAPLDSSTAYKPTACASPSPPATSTATSQISPLTKPIIQWNKSKKPTEFFLQTQSPASRCNAKRKKAIISFVKLWTMLLMMLTYWKKSRRCSWIDLKGWRLDLHNFIHMIKIKGSASYWKMLGFKKSKNGTRQPVDLWYREKNAMKMIISRMLINGLRNWI